MDFMSLATELNLVGKLVYNVLYKWVLSWGVESELIGPFALTVIVFTVILTLITMPLDVWQKLISRSNARKMEAMKPELEKVNKLYEGDKAMLMQKQRELYSKYKYSATKACLPMIVTMVLFLVVFGGFNSAVKHYNSVVFDDLQNVYETTYSASYNEAVAGGAGAEEAVTAATAAAENAVVEAYKPEKFLLTQNIFMPDTWADPVPDASTYAGTGMGKLGITDVDSAVYEKVMKPLIDKYNVTEKGKSAWNGYLILPVLVLVLSFVSSKLVKSPEQPQMAGQSEEQVKMQQSQMKMMAFVMPVIMGVFSLFYSTAFSLYMFIRSFLNLAFNLTWNIVQKKRDAEERDRIMSTTVKK